MTLTQNNILRACPWAKTRDSSINRLFSWLLTAVKIIYLGMGRPCILVYLIIDVVNVRLIIEVGVLLNLCGRPKYCYSWAQAHSGLNLVPWRGFVFAKFMV